MKKGLLSLVMIFVAVFASAQCDPVSAINENFDTWEGDPFSGVMGIGECWSTIGNGGMIYGDHNVTFYSFSSPNINMFLSSPEVVAGDYNLTFDAMTISMDGSQTEGVAVEVGTLTSATDASTYVAISEPFALTNDAQSIQLPISLTADAKFIAVKISTTAPHSAAGIDNFVLVPETAGVNDLNQVKVQVYPNPIVNQMHISADANIQEVKIFSVSGQLVQNIKLNSKSTTLNVSALKAGVYIAQIKTEKGMQTVKVVKK